MEYTTIPASKPGAPTPKIEKRTRDSKIFLVDCQALLCTNELIYGEVEVSNTTLSITEVQTRQGKFIKFRVSEGPTNVPYADYLINFTVKTSTKNELTVPVSIRVFSS
jgi:hypothetical protein